MKKIKGNRIFITMLCRAFCFCILLFTANTKIAANATSVSRDTILFISSYNPDTQRMTDFISNIELALKEKKTNYNILIEDMGFRSIDDAKDWIPLMEQSMAKYKNRNLRAIVLLGQEAWATFLALKEHPEGIPFFASFASQNGVDMSLQNVSDIKQWTPASVNMEEKAKEIGYCGGSLNVYDVEKNVELILSLYPNTENIALLTDNSYGGMSILSYVRKVMKEKYPNLSLIELDGRNATVSDIKARISKLSKHTAILIGSWRIDNKGRYFLQIANSNLVSPEQKIPVFSLTGIGIGSIAVGGYVPDYRNNADKIVEQIQHLYSDKRSKPYFLLSKNAYVFDKEMMKKMNINEKLLPKGSIIKDNVNKKLKEYQLYLMASLTAIVIVSILLLFVLIFYFRNKRLTRKLKLNEEKLIAAKEKAEDSERIKSTFIDNMSHEIRTPLNAIIGFTELLADSETAEERVEYQKIITKNTEVLLKLVSDVLDLSRLEAGFINLNYTLFDLNRLFVELESLFALRVKENVKIVFNPSMENCFIRMDKERLFQILSNFMGNAVKFTLKGSITIGYQPLPNKIRVFVTDTGKGISEKEQSLIFERFFKGNNFVQGTGLGLSICKMLAKRMQGEIGLESSEGSGSTFWCTIPCDYSDKISNMMVSAHTRTQENASKADDKSAEGRNIIVGIKNKLFVDRIKETFLGKAKIEVYTNGLDVVEHYTHSRKSIIILSQNLTDMSGTEVLSTIREIDKDVKIYFAVENEEEKALVSACSACATVNAFLNCPITNAEIGKLL